MNQSAKSRWTPLHAFVHQTLRQRQLLPHNSNLLVAVSGGQDSLCLLKLLVDLQSKWGWKIAVGHCDHRWSSDAGIADHVKKVAESFDLPFYLKVAINLKETEAEARKWRYQALTEMGVQGNFQAIVVAHTQSDRAETLLYNLIRGSGMDGLQALQWIRGLNPEIKLVRPLLTVSRQTTLEFCQQFKLPIWEDQLNQTLKYARNRLRLEIIPSLQEKFNPQVEKALAQTAEILQAEVEYLEQVAYQGLADVLSPNRKKLNRRLLNTFPLAIQRRIIRLFLTENLPHHPTFEQIESMVNLITAPNRSKTSTFSGQIIGEVQGEWIKLIVIITNQ
ncbi:MAG: tRNA lysidine(34) synthetase TilS [Microcystaceae cyanobacterium]